MKNVDSFKALSYKPYRRLFFGAMTSNIGTWVETVTIGIFMQTTTGSATLVAAAMAAGFVPQALMGLFSGTIADRLPRRNLLIFTNLSAAGIATFLCIAVAKGFAVPALVISLIFLTGFLNAVSFPTWQAFFSDIVPKENVAGALSLMSAQWNLGRIVGPAIAAIFVSGGHYSLALAANAVSFFLVVTTLLLVRENHYQQDAINRKNLVKEPVRGSLTAGWKFILSPESNLRKPYFVNLVSIFWASPFIALIPNVADDVFHSENLGTALFTTSQGLGALTISIFLTTLQIRYGQTRTQQVLFISLPIVMIGFGLAPNLMLASIAILFFGLTYIGTLTSVTLAGQLTAPPELRGRVSAAFMASLGFLFPLSSIIQSFFVEKFGAREVFVCTGIILLVSLISMGAFHKSYSLPAPHSGTSKIDAKEAIDD